MKDFDFELKYNPLPKEQSSIRDGIVDFNRSIINDTPICFNIYVKVKNAVIGGAIVYQHKDALYLDVLWLDEAHRGQGIGSMLLDLIGKEARKNDISKMFVDTYAFQAQEFYKKHGFQVIGIVPEYLLGHDRIFMRRDLSL